MMSPSDPKSSSFDFESYGSNFRISSGDPALLEWARDLSARALVGQLRELSGADSFSSVFELSVNGDGDTCIYQNGKLEGHHWERESMRKFIDALIRVAVAENAVDRLFVHAGAVGWKGKGIVLPGASFVGKSTLVAELVRCGAQYYSDDYAVFDREGRLHPFPRTLSMRADDGAYTPFDLTAEELGGSVGSVPLEVGEILFTSYEKNAAFDLTDLPVGRGALEMVPYTFSFVNRPEFSMNVLNNITARAIILSGQRGSAEIFAKTFLDFVDKHRD